MFACSVEDAVHQHQSEPKRQDADSYTHQHEEGPSDLERRSLPCALMLFRGSYTIDWVERLRWACYPTFVKIQKSHDELSAFSPGAVYLS
jgi:hypothetical protein